MRVPEVLRSKNPRSKFSVSSLLLAGTLSFAGLFSTHDALALSGTLTSGSTVTSSPRETSGASGGATLIHAAAASEPTSTASSTSQVSGPSEAPSSGAGVSSSTSRRRAQTEEGTTHRRTSRTASTTHEKAGKGKAVVESKDKEVKPLPPPEKPLFSISSGWESRYIFHGLDIISFNSANVDSFGNRDYKNSSAIWYLGADASFEGAHAGLTYVQAANKTVPFIGFLRGDFTPEYYREVDLNLDYTVHVVAKVLDATVGYNQYFFVDQDFKGSHYQGEALFRLAYKQLPYITPNVTFFHYVSDYDNTKVGNLNGSLVEFRLDGLVPVIKSPKFTLAIAPYVSSVYNINYLKYVGTTGDPNANKAPGYDSVGGMSYVEMGLKVPMLVAGHFSVTPYGNYGLDLTDSDTVPINSHTGNVFGQRTHFWGGVTVSYNF